MFKDVVLPYETNMKLSAAPSNDVTAAISGHDETKLWLNKTVLTFTNSNRDDDQAVELTAVHDFDDLNEEIELTFSGSGTAPDNISKTTTVSTVIQYGPPYVSTTPSTSEDRPRTVKEGEEVTFIFRTSQAYESPVTVSLGDDFTRALVEGQESCFQLEDVNDRESVTITIEHDSDALDETVALHLIAGLDDRDKICNPSGISLLETAAHEVWLKVDDDEEFKLLVEPSAITVTEGDEAGEIFKVSLSEPPRNSVTVNISKKSGSELDLDKTQLLFLNANSQDVNVTAKEDTDDLTREMETLTLVASGIDFGTADTTVTVTIIEDEGLSLEAPSEITIIEGGSRTFTVSLSHRTSEEITVDIVSSRSTSELEFPAQLTFPKNTKSRTVTVRATSDDDDETGEVETLTLTAASGDYNGITAAVTVTITDKDLELVASPTSIVVTEEDDVGETFDVSLSHTPSSTVTVNIATEANSNLTLSGTELRFDAANTPQTVTVTAKADNNSLDETETITLTADENYARKTARVTVRIIDAQDPELVIVPTTINVPEGGGEMTGMPPKW